MESDLIYKFFPELDDDQREQIDALGALYTDWNEKINVVSRKDIANIYRNHVLHSLVLAKFFGNLASGTSFLDVGTGGGFPGVPLAVFYPECKFHLIDRICKKVRVASEVSASLGLKNVTFGHCDVREVKDRYDYVVSRAVMPLNDLFKLVRKNICISNEAVSGNKYTPGLVCLKGGDLTEESKGIKAPVITYPVREFIDLDQFDDKFIVYVPTIVKH